MNCLAIISDISKKLFQKTPPNASLTDKKEEQKALIPDVEFLRNFLHFKSVGANFKFSKDFLDKVSWKELKQKRKDCREQLGQYHERMFHLEQEELELFQKVPSTQKDDSKFNEIKQNLIELRQKRIDAYHSSNLYKFCMTITQDLYFAKDYISTEENLKWLGLNNKPALTLKEIMKLRRELEEKHIIVFKAPPSKELIDLILSIDNIENKIEEEMLDVLYQANKEEPDKNPDEDSG